MKVPYKFIQCKVKGCVRLHDSFYPMCSNHRKPKEDVAPVSSYRPSNPQREHPK